MEHREALRSYAAERYLLDQFTEAEREAYDAHFFECSMCAEEIVLTFHFMEDLRAVFGSSSFSRTGDARYDC
jgi:hypothetical protein